MILVDAHVHIYDCFTLQNFLDSALENFRAEAAHSGHLDNFTAVLLLTETASDNWFQTLEEYAQKNRTDGNWTFHPTAETCSIWARSDASMGLFLVAGRQIATSEDLEVLALLTVKQFQDGQSMKQTIQAVKASGAIPVIPWAFGKWMGIRDRVLRDTLAGIDNSELFLGDNSGRPGFLRRPSHFKLAESRGVRVLPGSDPLPFSSECRRIGSFGFWIDKPLNSQYPAREISAILRDPGTGIRPFGELEKPLRFFLNQTRMQFRKHLGKRFRMN